MVRAGLLRERDLSTWLIGRRDHNVAQVRRALALIDPRAESVPESVLRVHLHTAGLPLTPQLSIFGSQGNFVARADLADAEARIAIFYDGAWHALHEQLEKDRRQRNALDAEGWAVGHVTASMLARPPEIIALVRDLYRRPPRIRGNTPVLRPMRDE